MKAKIGAVGAVGALAAFAFIAPPRITHPVPVHPKTACASYDIEVKVHEGMPVDYLLTFCATGIRAGEYVCPRNSYTLPNPGERMNCTPVK